MGLFRRRPKPTAAAGQNEGLGAHEPVLGSRTVHERIEVTVEREWVSMMVRNPSGAPMVDRAATVIEESTATEVNEERGLEAPD
jgi:hypothetical protein